MVEYKTKKRTVKTTEKEAAGAVAVVAVVAILYGAYKFGNALDDYMGTLKFPSFDWPSFDWPSFDFPDINISLPSMPNYRPDPEERHKAEMEGGYYGGTRIMDIPLHDTEYLKKHMKYVPEGMYVPETATAPLATEEFKEEYPEHPTMTAISGLEVVMPVPEIEMMERISEDLGLVVPPTTDELGLVWDEKYQAWVAPEHLSTPDLWHPPNPWEGF